MPSNYTKEVGTGLYRQKRYYGNEMGIILLGLSCQEKNMQIQASQGKCCPSQQEVMFP
jgi:hypothetical protein